MPYTPVATNVTEPANTGVAASTAAAEFRALKLYMRDVLLAGIALKRDQSDHTFNSLINASLAGIVCGPTCQSNLFTCVTGSGYTGVSGFVAGSTAAALSGPSSASIGWSAVGASVNQLTSLVTSVTLNEWSGSINMGSAYPNPDQYYVFTVNNNKVKLGDAVVVNCESTGITGQCIPDAHGVVNGSFKIRIIVPSGFDGPQYPRVSFTVIKRSAV